MPTLRETILTLQQPQLSAPRATALLDEVLPERMLAKGLLILRDDEPEVTLSPFAYHYLTAAGSVRRSGPSRSAPTVALPSISSAPASAP